MPVSPFNYDDSNFTYLNDYNAVVGERWDQISQAVYGRSDFVNYIIEANWSLSAAQKQSTIILDNVALRIPEVDTSEVPGEGLPSWRL